MRRACQTVAVSGKISGVVETCSALDYPSPHHAEKSRAAMAKWKSKLVQMCERCAGSFQTSRSKPQPFCSRRCALLFRLSRQPSPEQRFWAKVDQSGDCWLWTNAVNDKGYGTFGFDGRVQFAHRVAWQITRGPIPTGEGYHGTCVLHRCDTPRCVNPLHLFLGTHTDNMIDMTEKGRQVPSAVRGEANGLSKLTQEQVIAIRADTRIQRLIAADYGVNQSLISLIKSGKVWKHCA